MPILPKSLVDSSEIWNRVPHKSVQIECWPTIFPYFPDEKNHFGCNVVHPQFHQKLVVQTCTNHKHLQTLQSWMFMIGFTVAYHTILSCSSPPKFWGPGQPPFPMGSAASGVGSGAPGWVWKSMFLLGSFKKIHGTAVFEFLGPKKLEGLLLNGASNLWVFRLKLFEILKPRQSFPLLESLFCPQFSETCKTKQMQMKATPPFVWTSFPAQELPNLLEGKVTWLDFRFASFGKGNQRTDVISRKNLGGPGSFAY